MLLVLNRVKLPPEALVRPTAFWTCLGSVLLVLSKPGLPEAEERTAYGCTCLTAPGSLATTASWSNFLVLCAVRTAQLPAQAPHSVLLSPCPCAAAAVCVAAPEIQGPDGLQGCLLAVAQRPGCEDVAMVGGLPGEGLDGTATAWVAL